MRVSRVLRCLAPIPLCAGASLPAAAQCDVVEHFPAAPGSTASYGRNLDVWRDRLAVASSQGVHVLERESGGWVERAVLDPPRIDDLALWRDTLLVGDVTHDAAGDNAGVVRVYERQGGAWTQVGELLPPPGFRSTSFGESVDLEGDTAVVGARSIDRAFVYERVGGVWGAPQILFDEDTGPAFFFGYDVAVSGDRIAVGMPYFSSEFSQGDGAGCIFERVGGTWHQIARITAIGGENAGLGAQVAIEGSLAAFGAPGAGGDWQPGRIYVFEETAPGIWPFAGQLERWSGTQFGWSPIRFVGGVLVAGHSRDSEHGHWSGAVLVFRRTEGTQWMSSRITLPGAQEDDGFGLHLAVWRDTVLAGARGRDLLVHDGGSFAEFPLFACDPDAASYCPGAPNSTGVAAVLAAEGRVSLDDPALELLIRHAPPGEHGIFFLGPEVQELPFGDGLLCVGPGATGYVRVPGAEEINSEGRVYRVLDFGAPPLDPPSGHLLPGTTWSFQFWYRDPLAGGSGFNLSNALRIGFTH